MRVFYQYFCARVKLTISALGVDGGYAPRNNKLAERKQKPNVNHAPNFDF